MGGSRGKHLGLGGAKAQHVIPDHLSSATFPSSAVEGLWTPWTAWSECSARCDSGVQTRNRSCSNPAYGGPECSGPLIQTRDCNTQPCKGVAWRETGVLSSGWYGAGQQRVPTCGAARVGLVRLLTWGSTHYPAPDTLLTFGLCLLLAFSTVPGEHGLPDSPGVPGEGRCLPTPLPGPGHPGGVCLPVHRGLFLSRWPLPSGGHLRASQRVPVLSSGEALSVGGHPPTRLLQQLVWARRPRWEAGGKGGAPAWHPPPLPGIQLIPAVLLSRKTGAGRGEAPSFSSPYSWHA